MTTIAQGQFSRLETPQRTVLECLVDGSPAYALAGDTVLTAVLTHRRNLRAFEFAKAARSGFCLMGACQDCWVHLASGEPIRACTTLIEADMHIITQRPGAQHV